MARAPGCASPPAAGWTATGGGPGGRLAGPALAAAAPSPAAATTATATATLPARDAGPLASRRTAGLRARDLVISLLLVNARARPTQAERAVADACG
jgi:hypothetical protein